MSGVINTTFELMGLSAIVDSDTKCLFTSGTLGICETLMLGRLRGLYRLRDRNGGCRTWPAAAVTAMMVMRSANNDMLTPGMVHDRRVLGVRMMPMMTAATVVVMMMMMFTTAESLGYVGRHIHIWDR